MHCYLKHLLIYMCVGLLMDNRSRFVERGNVVDNVIRPVQRHLKFYVLNLEYIRQMTTAY